MADYLIFHTVEGPFGADTGYSGYYSVGGWFVSPAQYEIYQAEGLGGIKDALYPAYTIPDTNETLVPPPPPLGLKDLNSRVELGGYYGSDLAYSFVGGNPVLYYYPEAKDMFPAPNFPLVPQVSFTAGFENRSGYIGTARWEGRNIKMRGGTDYTQPEYSGNLLAPGYSYPESFWEGE